MITIVGSYNTDLVARASHLPKPGETVMGGEFKTGAGGKGANQAMAAARAGAKVAMVAKLGDDDFGKVALDNFKKEGMETKYCGITSEAPTGTALITVDSVTSENTIVVVAGANHTFTSEDVLNAKPAVLESDIVLVQLEVNIDAIVEAIKLAGENGVKVVLNPAPYHELPEEVFKYVTYITPNETEAGFLAGIEVTSDETALQAAKIIMQKGVDTVIVTMGKRGCLVCEADAHYFVDAFVMDKVVDTTGAGDAFNGGFAHAVSQGKSIKDAVVFANAVGGLSVTRMGAAQSTPSKEEITEFLKSKGLESVII